MAHGMRHVGGDGIGFDDAETFQTAQAFGIVRLGIFDGSEGLIEFLIHLAAMPFFWLEAFEDVQMTAEVVISGAQLLDSLLRIVEITLKSGDVVKINIDGIGTLVNPMA